jgi:hypothetical protein
MVEIVQSHGEGLQEEAGIKLSAVVSDLFGVSGWAMLKLIAGGETDVEVLMKQARGTLRRKESQLREALADRRDQSGTGGGHAGIRGHVTSLEQGARRESVCGAGTAGRNRAHRRGLFPAPIGSLLGGRLSGQ